ncbi:MAG: DeoR/GlpR family DNA-binding transcription regulator [Schleiferilactobacillus harbinensis]|jgi:DeoR family lactose phosphotransferase system repressor|nr:DeoR/GlpR family DNA-binding transcription regulator [Schleiferilactobacillus harbinensis]MCI1913297.1 DeoR/GlpR family DNA-binding transcription regulator [Schleiferilactobacillus harbinensis]
MLKRERLLTIRELVDRKGIVTVTEIGENLGVSAMTVRRDLDELAGENLLIRIHGGAQSKRYNQMTELSRVEKRNLHVSEKTAIAKIIGSMIHDGDTVYIGPGTTNELVAEYITATDVRVITNSLPVFQSFQSRADHFSLQLIGGRYRPRSGAFIGSLANEVLRRLRTDKAFVSVNGLDEQVLSNANTEEGETQRIALTNAGRRYAVADHSKLNRRDFYGFYDTSQLDGIVTDPQITNNDYTKYRHLTAVFSKPKK